METMMSKCPNCGWQDARNVQFCPRCGAQVIHGDSQNAAAANPMNQYSNAAGAMGGYPPQQPGNQYVPNAGNMNYGSAPQPGFPPRPGGEEEQPVRTSAPKASASSFFKPFADAFSSASSGFFKPSEGTDKGAAYVMSYLDALWKLTLIVWIILLVILLCVGAAGKSSTLVTCLIVFLLGIPVLLYNYIVTKILGTFFEMANDVSAIHSSLDSIRENQHKDETDSKQD